MKWKYSSWIISSSIKWIWNVLRHHIGNGLINNMKDDNIDSIWDLLDITARNIINSFSLTFKSHSTACLFFS